MPVGAVDSASSSGCLGGDGEQESFPVPCHSLGSPFGQIVGRLFSRSGEVGAPMAMLAASQDWLGYRARESVLGV
jgi:hypothetical protein